MHLPSDVNAIARKSLVTEGDQLSTLRAMMALLMYGTLSRETDT